MKKNDFLRHLKTNGCILLREGSKHSIWQNPKNNNQSSVHRHNDIDNMLCRAICNQLDIPSI